MRRALACLVALVATAATSNAAIIVTGGSNYTYGYAYNSNPYGNYYASWGTGPTSTYANSQYWIAGGSNNFAYGYAYAQQTVNIGAVSTLNTSANGYGYRTTAGGTTYSQGYGESYDYLYFTLTNDYRGDLRLSTFATAQASGDGTYAYNQAGLYNYTTGSYIGGFQDAYNSYGTQYSPNDSIFLSNVYLPAGNYVLFTYGYGNTYGTFPSGSSFGQYSSFAGLSNLVATPEPISLVVFGGLVLGGGLVARKRLLAKKVAA